jgi:hypothetical protein
MSTNANLWGDLTGLETAKSPIIILKEQASQLTKMTKGLLEGQVKIERYLDRNQEEKFRAVLYIKAPALDNYRAAILSIISGLEAYPVTINDLLAHMEYEECDNEEEFILSLEKLLQSDRVKKALLSLISQSKAV